MKKLILLPMIVLMTACSNPVKDYLCSKYDIIEIISQPKVDSGYNAIFDYKEILSNCPENKKDSVIKYMLNEGMFANSSKPNSLYTTATFLTSDKDTLKLDVFVDKDGNVINSSIEIIDALLNEGTAPK